LVAVPRGPADVSSTEGRLEVNAGAAPPPPADLACHVLHARLPPYDAPIDERAHTRIDQVWKTGQAHFAYVIENAYGRGERAFVALDCDVPGLAWAGRLGARRVARR